LAISGKKYEAQLELNEKRGSLVRVGPSEVLSSDLELLRKINVTKSTYAKGSSYSGSRFNPYHESSFIIRNPIEHDKVVRGRVIVTEDNAMHEAEEIWRARVHNSRASVGHGYRRSISPGRSV
jgi:hypothetical protein